MRYCSAWRLHEISENSFASRVGLVSRVSLDRFTVFRRAVTNVLSTDLAVETFAQIIDGLPIADVAWDSRRPSVSGNHPLDEHEELCPGTMDKARELRDGWDPALLKFDPKVRPALLIFTEAPTLTVDHRGPGFQLVTRYQSATIGSKAFETRLIKLVAVVLHQLGVIVFNLDFRLRGNRQNRNTVDFLFAITRQGIYRDIWERKPPTEEEAAFWARRPKAYGR